MSKMQCQSKLKLNECHATYLQKLDCEISHQFHINQLAGHSNLCFHKVCPYVLRPTGTLQI